MRLVMNEGHEHAVYGKIMRAGEEFEVPDNEASTWMTIGWARRARPATIITKAPSSEDLPDEQEQQKHSKRYNRRDMRAEEK